MSIMDRYEQRVFDMYLQTHPDADPVKVMGLIRQLTDSRLKNIPCVLHNDVTREKINTTVIDTFDWIDSREPIITGNGTFTKQHEEELSPTVKMLEKLQKDRDIKKKEMYTYPKGSIEYMNAYVGQISIKVIMNADYGGSGTPLSPFFSVYIPPATTGSAKAITTTLICCLELLSGNTDRWAKLNCINELYDFIFIVLNEDTSDRQMIIDTFSVEEVLQRLLSMVNEYTLQDAQILKLYLGTLGDSDRCKLMLAFNVRYVLTHYVVNEIHDIMDYLKSNPVDFDNITKESLDDDITKESLAKSGYGVDIPEQIIDVVNYVGKVVVDNCVYPFFPNDNEVRANNMKRLIVCVTDTDSLMVHFSSYIKEFQADVGNFRDTCIIASAFGMRLFIENVIPKMVENIAISSNVKDKYYRDKLIFKNEFAFSAMALFAKKMYAASMFVQEGSPRDPHDIAVTGLSFKKRDSAEFLEPIMLEWYDKYILTTKNIDVSGILNECYALRDKLSREITTDPSYYKVLSVKDISVYDASKSLPAQIRGSIVWNNIMPDEEILPMDRVIVIPLSFDLLEQNKHNGNVAEVLRLSLIDNPNKKIDPVICLPEYYKTIPDWIQPVIDDKTAIDKLLSPCKQILGLFDVYTAETKGGMIPSRMVFI